jgi:hypothetical protein
MNLLHPQMFLNLVNGKLHPSITQTNSWNSPLSAFCHTTHPVYLYILSLLGFNYFSLPYNLPLGLCSI